MKNETEFAPVLPIPSQITEVFARFANEMISAGVVTAVYAIIAWWYRWPQVFGMVVFVVSLAIVRFQAYKFILWIVETWLGRDMDGDGIIGQVAVPDETTRPVMSENRGKQTVVEVSDKDGLTDIEWSKTAVALLHRHAPVSRRGIAGNSTLSQSRAGISARLLRHGGLADDNGLTHAGRIWLAEKLPHPAPNDSLPDGLTGSPTNQTS